MGPIRSRGGLILSGLLRAALLLGMLCIIPFIIARSLAEMTGERR